MNKEVKIDNDRKVMLFDNKDETIPNVQISEYFYADGLECAHYTLLQAHFFKFAASLDLDLETEENKNTLTFTIDVDHPLFFPLLHLLNGEKEIFINDDRDEKIMKYLNIKNNDDSISLNFVDKKKHENIKDRFVIISDTKYDYLSSRNAAQNNNFKKRISDFFDEACEVLFEDSHQISFEEYTLKKSLDMKDRKSS